MTRKLLLLAAAASIVFASCKEKNVFVPFDVKPVTQDSTAKDSLAKDTTYVGTPEAASARRVLIEEFTGVKCPNCPVGHQVLAQFVAQYPDRVSVIGYQAIGDPQTLPITGETRNDNRTQKGTDIGSKIFGGVPALPVAGFDRIPVNGLMLNNRTVWAQSLNNRLAVAAPVNLTLTPVYDSVTRKVRVKVRMAFTTAMTGKQRLSIAVVENNVVDAQESTSTVFPEYDHEHVFRDFITATDGDPILDAVTTKEAGRVFERTLAFTLNPKWVAANCHFVAIVHSANADSKEVYQSAEVSVRP